MRIEDRVIPARFLVTLGHLVGVIMISKTKSDNVYAGLSSDPTVAEVATANSHVNVSLNTCCVCEPWLHGHDKQQSRDTQAKLENSRLML